MQGCIDKSIEWLVNFKQRFEGMNKWLKKKWYFIDILKYSVYLSFKFF